MTDEVTVTSGVSPEPKGATVKTKTTFKLEGFQGADDRELVVVGGPHPYVWIGTTTGEAFAATRTTADLRKLRDALTEALES